MKNFLKNQRLRNFILVTFSIIGIILFIYPDLVSANNNFDATRYELSSHRAALDPPVSISASDGSYTDQVYVGWNTVSGATYYEIYRCINSSISSCGTALSAPKSAEYHDYEATPGITYYYRIKTCNTEACSDFSNFDMGYRALIPPSAPSTISASDGSYTDHVYINWSDSSTATYYEIFRCTTSSISSCGSALNSPTSLEFNDYGATPGVIYYYRAKACNSAGCSDFSNFNTGYRALTPPSGLYATSGDFTDRIYITWVENLNATFYQVYRCTSATTSSCSPIASPTTCEFNDFGVTPGETYYYLVKACTSAACSDVSNFASGFLGMSPPASITASDGIYTDHIYVDWSDSAGAEEYQIYRCGTSSTSSCGSMLSSPTTSDFNDYSATPGVIYYYRAKACYSDVCSDFSPYDTGDRRLTPPSAISASDGSFTDHVFVDWFDVTYATYYQIFRCATSSTSSCGSLLSSPTSPGYNDYGATPDVVYYYRVKACSSAGCSDLSNFDTGYFNSSISEFLIFLPLVIKQP